MQANKSGYPEIESNGNLQFYPLSFQQERVLYLNKLSADGPLWNRISCKRLIGSLDVEALKKAVDALVQRHSALRTKITSSGGTPRQSKHETVDGAFEYADISGFPPESFEDHARTILDREYAEPMVLEAGPLFRAILVRCSDNEHWLILKLHHIISDATSIRILWNDLKALYNAREGGGEVLRPLEVEYFDYAKWVRDRFGENDLAEQEAYWLRQFAGVVPELDLPSDRPASATLSFNGALERWPLSQGFVKQLQAFSLDRRVIPFSTMLAAYYLLLYHYCRQEDVVIGTVFSGRHYAQKLNALAGFFSNTVAIRAHLDRAQTVEELVKSVHALVTGAYENQDYPFQRLVDRLNPGREHKRNPLFRALFNMVTDHEETRTFDGIEREEWREPEISATQVDFFLDFHMGAGRSELRVEYNADIFGKTTIRRMLRHYARLLEGMLDAPHANALGLGMLDAEERQLVLSFGEGIEEPAEFIGIVELLEERAERTPQQQALLYGNEILTCGHVNRRANQLAATLVQAGVAEGDIVAIIADRSPEMVIGLLAILKAGAAYLPIDPAFPRQRIEFILRDSGVTSLLVAGDVPRVLSSENGLRVIAIDRESAYIGDGSNPGRKTDPAGPVYVIYTSGSTGNPKGVVVEHRALMNTLCFLEARFALTGKTILLKTNFTFDVSTTELFGWLFDSGRLAVLDKGAEKDPAKLLEAIATFGVTHVNFVPSMLDVFLAGLHERDIRTLDRLHSVFVAGEALKPDLAQRFHELVHGVRLEDLYGPTEAAVYATWYSLERGKELRRVPIGKPLSNTRAYILDETLQLVPVGLTGELCLSGAGLARGYLNAPELTQEKFCANPYWEGERLYRTGDLALWDDDGQIQFLGRDDSQVKIRGFRVEIGEVERKLLACSGVAEGAVKVKTDQFGQKSLAAYLIGAPDGNGNIDQIRAELASWLPAYMIPEQFVEVESLPRLASGKIDLQALPEPDAEVAGSPAEASVAAATELEQTIIGIAENLLNASGLGRDSNFFHLGGNSLLTLRFIAALDDALGTRLSVMDFLSLPTIAQIAKLVETTSVRPPRNVAFTTV